MRILKEYNADRRKMRHVLPLSGGVQRHSGGSALPEMSKMRTKLSYVKAFFRSCTLCTARKNNADRRKIRHVLPLSGGVKRHSGGSALPEMSKMRTKLSYVKAFFRSCTLCTARKNNADRRKMRRILPLRAVMRRHKRKGGRCEEKGS